MALFACIGDIHEEFERLETVVEWLRQRTAGGVLESTSNLDGVLLSGDLAESGVVEMDPPGREERWRAKVDRVLATGRSLGVPVVWVPGNHDQRGYESEPGNADGRMIEVAGVRIVGIGGAGPRALGFRYEWTEDDTRALQLPDGDILLSHCPPIDSAVDCTFTDRSAGSKAIRERAQKHRGVLVCGHVHEAFGTDRIRNCVAYNVGSLSAPYGARQCGLLDFDPPSGRVTIRHVNLDIQDETTHTFSLPPRRR